MYLSVQRLHHMPQCQRTRVSTGECPDNKQINKRSVTWQTWTLHQSSSISLFYIFKLDRSLVYIDKLDQLMKIINLYMVVIPPPE